jgi:hypothetical protein
LPILLCAILPRRLAQVRIDGSPGRQKVELHEFLEPIAFLLAEYRRLGPIFRLRALHHRFTVLVGAEANAVWARTADRHLAADPSGSTISTGYGFALAPLLGLMMGMRSSEMTDRVVRTSTMAAQFRNHSADKEIW